MEALKDFFIPLSAFLGGVMAAGLIIAVCLLLLFSAFMLVFYTLAMMMGAKVVNIENRTFGKALTATSLNIFLGWLVVGVCFFIFPPLSIVAYFLLPSVFIKWIYECSFIKAIIAAVLSYFAAISLFLLLFLVMVITFKLNPNKNQKEKVTKVEIKNPTESSPIKSNNKELVSIKSPIKETLKKIPVKKPHIEKSPSKASAKIKTRFKNAIAKNPKNKTQQIRPLSENKKRQKVKLEPTTQKPTIKLAKH